MTCNHVLAPGATICACGPRPAPEAIHGWFGLSYANYLVLPRSILQSMPDEWQARFVAELAEIEAAFGHLAIPAYDVRCLARECELIRPECAECEGEGTMAMGETCESCNGEGLEDELRYETPEEVGFIPDPIPHYNRGRTRLAPVEGGAS